MLVRNISIHFSFPVIYVFGFGIKVMLALYKLENAPSSSVFWKDLCRTVFVSFLSGGWNALVMPFGSGIFLCEKDSNYKFSFFNRYKANLLGLPVYSWVNFGNLCLPSNFPFH